MGEEREFKAPSKRERNSRFIQLYFILFFKLQKDENHRVISSLTGVQVDTAFR